jgi:hypothetical protein
VLMSQVCDCVHQSECEAFPIEKLQGHICVTVHEALSGKFGESTEIYAVKGVWSANNGNGHPAGRGSSWEVTTENGMKGPWERERENQIPC